ncbi:MAG: terminase gpA endonuclease subunit, partial [Planctomycetota bacterium]
MRPSDVVRLLNSTDAGQTLNERQLYRHRMRAGFRIGDGKRIDLLRYIAWLVDQVHGSRDTPPPQDYEAKKEAARSRNAAIARAGRDIAPLPEVVDAQRKERGRTDFRFFCETYFPLTFYLGWSNDHLRVIAKIEEAVLHGGLFAMAMPRASGKTSAVECACLWAVLYGHHEFVALIGSDEQHAADMLDSLKTELETNDLLREDFPEVTHPIRSLEGIPHRSAGQLFHGERTHIGWTAKEIILPTIPGSSASGGIIRVAGITGRIRGMKYKRADGRTVRPSLVIPDDPQTDESARSLSQCQQRERVLAGAILGLAGPGRKISGIMPCTVIRPGDMADRILDREAHPEWNGERTKMVYRFPDNERLWERYAIIRADGLRDNQGLAPATAFYTTHRAAMDAGAQVAWEQRYNPDEISALQHAMNLKLQDEHAFWAEYQNEPLHDNLGSLSQLTVDDICSRLNGLPERMLPASSTFLTGFIDVQGTVLYWGVCAWEVDFSGAVVSYSTHPQQGLPYFTLQSVSRTLQDRYPGTGMEGSIYAGLEDLVRSLLSTPWRDVRGGEHGLQVLLIDANWGQSTDIVYNFCQAAPYGGIVLPSHGRYVGASTKPFAEYRRRPGDRIGLNWRIVASGGQRGVAHALYDTNYWKTFLHERLATPMGDRHGLTLFGKKPQAHRMIAEHCCAEYRVRTAGRGREVDEWKVRPQASDNHLWDVLVGCAVGASIVGAAL